MPVEYGARYISTQVAGQVICGGLIFLLFKEKKDLLLKYPLWGISIFWIAVLTLSFAFSVARLASLEELMRNVMYISLPMIIYSWCDTKNRIKLLSYTVLFAGTIVSLIGIISFLINYSQTLIFEPAYAPLSRSNDLGAFMLLTFSLALANFLYEEESPLEKAFYALVSILSFITIVLTFSRGIWLSCLISLILIFILGRKILRKNLIYIGIVAILCIIPVIMNWEDIVHRFFSLQNIFSTAENSIEWRKSLLRGSFRIFLDHPVIGTGLNTFPFVYSLYQERAGYFSINPHNYYLQLLTETGVVGFTTFIVLALSILYMSFKAFNNSEKIFKGIALGLLVGIISSLIHISVDIDWSVAAIPIMFWTHVGLLISIYSSVGFKETRFSEFNDRFNYIKRPVLVAISVFIIFVPTMNYLSLYMYTKGAYELENNHLQEAKKYNYWAIKLAPWPSAKHHNSYASILFRENHLQEALKYIEKAIYLDKYNYNFYKTYSDILIAVSPENKEKALQVLKKAVELNPYIHPKLYEFVGDFYLKKMKQPNEAINWYQKAIEHFPLVLITSYERYTPDDRYELYRIYKKLGSLSEKDSPVKAKEYKYLATYLLANQPEISSKLGDLTSKPTATIINYWAEFSHSPNTINKFVLEGADVPIPDIKYSYKFIDFVNIEHSIFSVKLEYKVIVKDKNEENKFTLVDIVVPTDNGWIITERKSIMD